MATPDEFSWMMSLTMRNECGMTSPFEKKVLCDLMVRNHERCEMMWHEFLQSTRAESASYASYASEFDRLMALGDQLPDCSQSEPSGGWFQLDNDMWTSDDVLLSPPHVREKKTPGKPRKRKVARQHSNVHDGNSCRKRLFRTE